MQEREFVALCRNAVVEYFNSQADSTDKNGTITEDDVYVFYKGLKMEWDKTKESQNYCVKKLEAQYIIGQ